MHAMCIRCPPYGPEEDREGRVVVADSQNDRLQVAARALCRGRNDARAHVAIRGAERCARAGRRGPSGRHDFIFTDHRIFFICFYFSLLASVASDNL